MAVLDEDDRTWALELLIQIRTELNARSSENKLRLHYLRRYVVRNLGYDEKSTPAHRKALKQRKMKIQDGKCALCGGDLPDGGAYSVLDRLQAHLGYIDENVQLVHANCDYKQQAAKGYT